MLTGMAINLSKRGVPPFFAMQLAGAVYTSGAKKEQRISGFPFATAVMTPTEVVSLLANFDKTFSPNDPIPNELSFTWLHLVFGRAQVAKWQNDFAEEVKQPAVERPSDDLVSALGRLGLSADATREQVDQRYRDLCRQYHPDRNQQESEPVRRQKEKTLADINNDYKFIIEHPCFSVPSGPRQRTTEKPSSGTSTQGRPKPTPPRGESPPPPQPSPSKSHSWLGYVLMSVGLVILVMLCRGLLATSHELKLPRQVERQVVVTPPATSPPPVPAPRQAPRPTPRLLPRPTPQATTRSEATKLGRAIASARVSLAKRDYDGAVRILEPLFAREQPVDARDDKEWVAYLALLEESRSRRFRNNKQTPSEMDKYRHWPAMHDLALAWHFHMKHAIGKNDRSEAMRAFQFADTRYQSVINAVTPTTRAEQGQEWRRDLVGLAMENRAAIRKQLSGFTRDQSLFLEAKHGFEECRDYYAARIGRTSKGYVRAVEELKNLSSLATRE